MTLKGRKEETVDSDFILIRRMKQGREEAMEHFVRKYYDEILKYCTYHCQDAQYGEDFTQEVFVRFFAGLAAYEYQGKTKNYLYTIAGNLCRDFYRKSREIPMEQQVFEQEKEENGKLEKVAERLDMEQALRKLPEELREVLILYYFQELKLR